MTIADAAFRISAIPPETLDRIRAAGQDDLGNSLQIFVDEEGGSPLRCCLRPATAGERLMLIAYRPFRRPGPYAEVGPVFIHAGRCAGYDTPEQYPPGFRDWPTLIFRPYHFDGRMAYPALAMVEGRHAEQANRRDVRRSDHRGHPQPQPLRRLLHVRHPQVPPRPAELTGDGSGRQRPDHGLAHPTA